MPVAPPTQPPNGRRGVARLPWQQSPVTPPGDAAEIRKHEIFTKMFDIHRSSWVQNLPAMFSLADLQKQRQISMSQIKVPPSGQHAVNHVDEGQQETVGSAPFRSQIGQLNGNRRRPTILQETQRLINCTDAHGHLCQHSQSGWGNKPADGWEWRPPPGVTNNSTVLPVYQND